MPVLQARVSEKEAYEVKAMAKSRGLTVSELVRESLAVYATKNAPTLSFGDMSGKIWIADDFDELPDGFEEYV